MKTLFNLKTLLFIFLIAFTFSCKTSSDPVATESDAIKAGDSTSINSGSKGTTRGANEGNEGGQEADPKTDR
ncbi:hypothetical protein [Flavobacterium sp. HTF]|uniref:hypothetical protein n=1 Tax=Flavobacterium sp. HTF TaxID=2170732 RepID=UPI000D5E8E53|nr:hypothetical protein [Flavobacterium sp. HTF]PWB22636.1 hypothetical protein DCO46_16670 [Flavobacterium sp. HTF]